MRMGAASSSIDRAQSSMCDGDKWFAAGFWRSGAGIFCTREVSRGSETDRIAHPDDGAVTNHVKTSVARSGGGVNGSHTREIKGIRGHSGADTRFPGSFSGLDQCRWQPVQRESGKWTAWSGRDAAFPGQWQMGECWSVTPKLVKALGGATR